MVARVGGDFEEVYDGGCLSTSQCNQLLYQMIISARNDYDSIYKDSVTCKCAQDVLVDMAYNLGRIRLKSFIKFEAHVKNGNWLEAAAEMEDSLWCKQVGSRCARNKA